MRVSNVLARHLRKFVPVHVGGEKTLDQDSDFASSRWKLGKRTLYILRGIARPRWRRCGKWRETAKMSAIPHKSQPQKIPTPTRFSPQNTLTRSPTLAPKTPGCFSPLSLTFLHTHTLTPAIPYPFIPSLFPIPIPYNA